MSGGSLFCRLSLAVAMGVLAAADAVAGGLDFTSRRMLAGKAKVAGSGYVVTRSLGRANLSPELAFPVELVYDSDNERSGIFGFAWSSPQLGSSARWDKDGMLWTSPWGERMKFFAKDEKTPDDAVKLEVVEEAKKGRGYYSPYSDWEADVVSGDAHRDGNWVVRGRRGKSGWSFVYSGTRLVKMTSPAGTSAEFAYGDAGLKSVSQFGVEFLKIAYTGKVATSVSVNGVETRLAYSESKLEILPQTGDGHAVHPTLPRLVSLRRGSLAPETYSYEGNYLASVGRGGVVDNITFARDGRTVRIVSDMNFDYECSDGRVTLRNRAGLTASYAYDAKNGVFRIFEFSGRKYQVFYFLRYDVAYLGSVRKIVDGKGDDVIGYRYDAKSGNVTRIRDRFGNDRSFEYDSLGRLARTTRRAAGDRTVEPVAAFAYGNGREPVSVSLLDAKGSSAVTTKITRDSAGRPVSVDDGRIRKTIAYNRFGYPTEVKDVFGNTTKVCYNIFNVPVRITDANGIVTEYSHNADGLVTSVVRKDVAETLASVEIAYDDTARPVSVKDQDGRITAFDRDEFGRILKEKFADGSEVAYSYDAFGRRTSVIDENGHRISFGWSRFGLSSRTTAANQLTDYVRDDEGLVTEILSKQGGRTDRSIRNSYDGYGRIECIDYGSKENEKFTYDKWGRIASHSRGESKTTYAYDHFGRLVSQKEDGNETTYVYDRYGSRTLRLTRNRRGEIVSKETRRYDKYGRLAETAAFGSSVKYAYDSKGRLASQTIDGELIEYVYTRRGQLAGKYLGGKLKPDASVEYEYARNGQVAARTANGVRQTYEYDLKGQLLGVREGDEYVERYCYDKAGNMLEKSIRRFGGAGRPATAADYKTTTFTFDDANQLVSSTCDGVTTRYEYDAAGRLVREGDRTYTYGYLDKVLSVTEGERKYTYSYHPDGQLARADYGKGGTRSVASEEFFWDGLALIRRGDEQFINEPHVGGGNPVVSSKGTSFFNDMLGTTVGVKSGKKYSAATLTAFGEDLNHNCATCHLSPATSSSFFTGKPLVDGLGHAFLFRNYRAGLGKWQTADPLGYPDGWNALAYCGNGVTSSVDLWGCKAYDENGLTEDELRQLDGALRMWILDVSTIGQLFEDVRNHDMTLSFLKRYMNKAGDQTLDYSTVSGEQVIENSNEWVIDQVRGGNLAPSDYSIIGPQWANDDLSTSIGGCLIHYKVSMLDGWYIIDCCINDPYDFHSKLSATFSWLGFEGFLYGWNGGETVYDTWMRQLADSGYASVFNTKIKWQLRVNE